MSYTCVITVSCYAGFMEDFVYQPYPYTSPNQHEAEAPKRPHRAFGLVKEALLGFHVCLGEGPSVDIKILA